MYRPRTGGGLTFTSLAPGPSGVAMTRPRDAPGAVVAWASSAPRTQRCGDLGPSWPPNGPTAKDVLAVPFGRARKVDCAYSDAAPGVGCGLVRAWSRGRERNRASGSLSKNVTPC
jgi:hypothetical protein